MTLSPIVTGTGAPTFSGILAGEDGKNFLILAGSFLKLLKRKLTPGTRVTCLGPHDQ